MKTGLKLFLIILTAGTIALAASWERQSAPFTFPGTVRAEKSQISQMKNQFSWSRIKGKKAVSFSYSLLAKSSGASISIHSLNGVLIERIPIDVNSATAQWNMNNGSCGSGVYLAILEFNNTRRELRFGIVE